MNQNDDDALERALRQMLGRKLQKEDISRAAQYVLPHRMHKNPLDNGQMNPEMMEQILSRKGEKRESETSGEGD